MNEAHGSAQADRSGQTAGGTAVDSALEAQGLALYQAALPVALIATPREAFVTCAAKESLADVRRRNATSAFDHFPVIGDRGAVVGVLDFGEIEHLPGDRLVADHLRPLGEEWLAGASMCIYDFLRDADTKPFRLLVTAEGIGGLVSLSDVQKLPVRAALFAMVTQLEMAMAAAIRRHLSDADWMDHLSVGRQEKLRAEIERAEGERNQVEALLYTQFADKVTILRRLVKAHVADCTMAEFTATFRKFEKLRNDLAHANDLAVTRQEARRISALTRSMALWLPRLQSIALHPSSISASDSFDAHLLDH